MHATKAAVEEGIVPGGGVTLLRATDKLVDFKLSNDEEMFGVKIVLKALEEPIRMITLNAGVDGSIIVEKIREKDGDFGYDAQTLDFVNMYEAGIIDPAKVVRSAIENASSIAGLLLTTEALIHEIPEEKKDMPAMPPDMGGMGGMGGMY